MLGFNLLINAIVVIHTESTALLTALTVIFRAAEIRHICAVALMQVISIGLLVKVLFVCVSLAS